MASVRKTNSMIMKANQYEYEDKKRYIFKMLFGEVPQSRATEILEPEDYLGKRKLESSFNSNKSEEENEDTRTQSLLSQGFRPIKHHNHHSKVDDMETEDSRADESESKERTHHNFKNLKYGQCQGFRRINKHKIPKVSKNSMSRQSYKTSINKSKLFLQQVNPVFVKLFDKLMNSKIIDIEDLILAEKEVFYTETENCNPTHITSYDIFLLVLDNKFYSSDKRNQESFLNIGSKEKIISKINFFLKNPEKLKETKKRKNEEYRKKIFKAFINSIHKRLPNEIQTKSKKKRTKDIYCRYHRYIILQKMLEYQGDVESFAKSENINFLGDITPESLKQITKYDFPIEESTGPIETAFIKIFFSYIS